MKLKTIATLLILAVLIGALAYYTSREKKTAGAPGVLGRKVLPGLPLNRIAKIVLTSPEGVTTLSKVNDKWSVASRFNYPANFDKIADTMRELSELKIGQTVNAGASELGSFNLLDPRPADTNKTAGAGTLVELRDEKDGLLASLVIGKNFTRQSARPEETMMGFGGFADGQYLKTMDNKVCLVSQSLGRLTEDGKTWLDNSLVDVSSGDLKEISVTGPERAEIKLVRQKDGDSLVLSDLKPEEGTPETSKINQMANALNQLGFDDVAAPAISLKETGLDRPVVFTAAANDGLIYKIKIGNALANDSFNRYFTISVTNEPAAVQESSKEEKETKAESTEKNEKEPKKNPAELAAALNAKFGSWVYTIKSYRSEPLLYQRNDLIKKPEPPKAEGTQTNAPPAKSKEKGKKTSKSKTNK